MRPDFGPSQITSIYQGEVLSLLSHAGLYCSDLPAHLFNQLAFN